MSQVAIWNLALGHLGDRANVSTVDEGSRQAELCRLFYPMTRRSALEAHEWGFATRVKLLAPSPFDALLGWTVAATGPADSLKIIAVGLPGEGRKFCRADYQMIGDEDGNPMILTDLPSAQCVYLVDVEDVGKWSPLFTEAVSWLLASHLAGPIITGDAGRAESRRLLEEFRTTMLRAAGSDASQQGTRRLFDFTPLGQGDRGPAQTDLWSGAAWRN